MDYIVLIIIVVIAVLAGTTSRANTKRKADRMINDLYDERYKDKK